MPTQVVLVLDRPQLCVAIQWLEPAPFTGWWDGDFPTLTPTGFQQGQLPGCRHPGVERFVNVATSLAVYPSECCTSTSFLEADFEGVRRLHFYQKAVRTDK